MSSKRRRRERPQERAHRPALELEHADRVALAEHLERLLVVERHLVDVGANPGGRRHQVERDLEHVEVAEAEEVHLEEAEVLDAVHLVLGDDRRVGEVATGFGLALHRDVLGERVAGDDHRRGVDAVLTAQALEAACDVDDPLRVRVGLVELAELGRHLVAALVLGRLDEAGGEWRVATHDERRHELGDLVADEVRVAEDSRRVAHRGPRLDRRERDDLSDVVVAVRLRGVADELAAVARVEVHVDVGHLLAARVEEPLEQQVVLDRVDVDDAQAVRDARAGRAPPARPDADLGLARVAHEIPDDEEVRREPHRLDDAELVLDAARTRVAGARRRSAPSRPRA